MGCLFSNSSTEPHYICSEQQLKTSYLLNLSNTISDGHSSKQCWTDKWWVMTCVSCVGVQVFGPRITRREVSRDAAMMRISGENYGKNTRVGQQTDCQQTHLPHQISNHGCDGWRGEIERRETLPASQVMYLVIWIPGKLYQDSGAEKT